MKLEKDDIILVRKSGNVYSGSSTIEKMIVLGKTEKCFLVSKMPNSMSSVDWKGNVHENQWITISNFEYQYEIVENLGSETRNNKLNKILGEKKEEKKSFMLDINKSMGEFVGNYPTSSLILFLGNLFLISSGVINIIKYFMN